MISITSRRRNPMTSSATETTTRFSPLLSFSACAAAIVAPFAGSASLLGSAGWLRLAMTTLDIFGERGDFLNRGGKILGATCLLFGGGGRLGGRAPSFLGGGGDLLRALCTLFHRNKETFGGSHDLFVV